MTGDHIATEKCDVAPFKFGRDSGFGAHIGEFVGLSHRDRKAVLPQIGGIVFAAPASGIFEEGDRWLALPAAIAARPTSDPSRMIADAPKAAEASKTRRVIIESPLMMMPACGQGVRHTCSNELAILLLRHAAAEFLQKCNRGPDFVVAVISPGRHARHFDAILDDPEQRGRCISMRWGG